MADGSSKKYELQIKFHQNKDPLEFLLPKLA